MTKQELFDNIYREFSLNELLNEEVDQVFLDTLIDLIDGYYDKLYEQEEE